MNTSLAPIILFVYNRPTHTQKVIEALLKNEEAKDSILYVFADGPKNNASKFDIKLLKEVSYLVSNINGFKEIIICERSTNYGLKNNIVESINEVFLSNEKIIVLEDDIVPQIGFLNYMNNALNIYENELDVMHISAFIYPLKNKNTENTFFYNVNSCWGWGTWKRAWKYFDKNPQNLLKKVNQNYNEQLFNGGQKNFFYKQLQLNTTGVINTWAVLWHSSIYINNGLCLHPNKSLVVNIGFDNSGQNSGKGKIHGEENKTDFIKVEKLDVNSAKKSHRYISKIIKKNFETENKKTLKMAKNIFKKIKNIPIFLNKDLKELNRIKKIPRYIKSRTTFLNHEIEFVDSITYLYGIKEIFKTDIYKFNSNTINPLIIDCGSNIGLSIIYFKQLFPNSIIEAFEPDPNIFETLSFNINSFGFKNVELNQKAIWNKNEKLKFKQEGGFSGRIPKPSDDMNLIEVDAIDLKKIIENRTINFLKLDIEGSEYEVLKSCKDVLGNIENIFIEYHSHSHEKQTLHEILEILQNQGFRYHIQEAFTRKKPFVDNELMLGMDLQLNIFGTKN